MISKDYIKNELPQIEKIKNKKLQEGIINIWLLACKRGNWVKIDDIPFTLAYPTKITLLEHTRRVAKLAIKIAEVREDLNFDILIAGALTHDVGKLLEYTRKDGKIVISNFGKIVRHPVSGYSLAIDAGLPNEVAHIISAHSKEGELVVRTKEAIVINHCDFIEFEIERR
jgi:putative nucleotidyltransferase with HDIG domain